MKNVTLVILLVVLMLCGTAQAWTTPQPVTIANTSDDETCTFLSNDGKTLYFSRDGGNHYNIYQATRQDTSGPFTSVTMALSRGSAWHVYGAWVSPDNLRMYYHDESPYTVKVSTRASVNDSWQPGTVVPGLSSFSYPLEPALTQDELTIVFPAKEALGGMGSYDIYMATRPNTSSAFGNIRNLSEINSSGAEGGPFLAPDGLALYFNSDRNGAGQLFKATRQSLNDPFGNPEHLSFFDSPYGVSSASLSADGSTLFFCQGQGTPDGFRDIYYSEVPEPVTLLVLGLGGLMLKRK